MNNFDRVMGYEDIKRELICISDVLRNSKRYEKLGINMPSGVLLYGEYGLGKTLMAKSLIVESGCPAFTIKKEEPGSDMANEIWAAFSEAKSAKTSAIVFLDHLDEGADANVYATVRACMDDCKNAGVFVIATANELENIPDYMFRAGRFEKIIEIETPSVEDAEKILNCYLSEMHCGEDVNVAEIAKIMRGHSCADLHMVANEAGIRAAFNKRDSITQQDLISACLRVHFAAPEAHGSGSRKEQLEAAVHEAGHAVAAEMLDTGSVALTSIARHGSGPNGVTCVDVDDHAGERMKMLEHLVIRGLAGKAATEIVLGMVDTGSTDDLQKAFARVSNFVDDYCAYGFETYEGRKATETLRAKKEQLIAVKLEGYYQEAKNILIKNHVFLDKVIDELMKYDTLTQKDVKRIRAEIGY